MAQDNEETVILNDSHSELPLARPFSLTVEIPLFLIMLAGTLAGASISNVILYRTCVHTLQNDEEVCKGFLAPDHLNNTQELEGEVQKYATFVVTAKMVLESVVPAVFALFLGVWSDTYGRKPLIVWPLFGSSLSAILIVGYAMMDQLGPWYYVLTSIPIALTGGFTSLFTGAFCYLSDITSSKSRSIRMTILEASLSAGTIAGSLSSSILLRAVGNVNLQLISAVLIVIAYAFTNVFLVESLNGARDGSVFSLMDFSLVKEMIGECFKSRPNKGRAQILLLIVSNSLSLLTLFGLINLDYMYTREKLGWSLKDYNNYAAVASLTSFFGSLLGVMLLQKLLRISDLALVIVAFVSTAIENIIKAFAFLTWHIYLGSTVALFRSLSSPLIRSHLTKILPVEAIAKVFALMCAFDAICPLLSPPMFNLIYVSTMNIFPGTIYLINGSMTFVCAAITGLVILFRRRTSTLNT